MKYHLTVKSSNRKTGRMPVSTSPAQTCPTACPFKGKGCYAEGGPLRMHWDKVSCGKRGQEWSDFVAKIQQLPPNTLWRHNAAGDLRGYKNRINQTALNELVQANRGKQGYTYSHYPLLQTAQAEHNQRVLKAANAQGFTVNLSSESLTQADQLLDLRIGPVVLTLPPNAINMRTPKGRKVIVCPAQTSERTCLTCKLCAKVDRKVVVGFLAHGFRRNKANQQLG